MTQQRNKGQAGMGGRGKNQIRHRQDTGTRRKRRMQALREPELPGSPPGPPAVRNQKRNQREWHAERRLKVKKAAGIT